MAMHDRLKGMIPPMVVPFDSAEEIDEEAFRKEARFLLASGVHGISVGGSTGEGALLSDTELNRCLEMLVEENTTGLPVFAGIIRNSTRDAVRAAEYAAALEVDVLLVTPVFYHGADDEGNYEFFRRIAESVKTPIVIYNVVPTNIITPHLFLRLLEIDEIIGIKQVDPVRLAEFVDISPPDALVYSACDPLLYGTYVTGACGAISALVTIAPELCAEQWGAYSRGDQKRAQEIHRLLSPIVHTYLQAPYPGKVKELLNLMGRSVGKARMPNTMPTAEQREKMRAALANAGLL
jgi:4-hydroxy-tetrahydrodipicolinate synthase